MCTCIMLHQWLNSSRSKRQTFRSTYYLPDMSPSTPDLLHHLIIIRTSGNPNLETRKWKYKHIESNGTELAIIYAEPLGRLPNSPFKR